MQRLIFLCLLIQSVHGGTIDDVTNLTVEPDYRAIFLKWRYPPAQDLVGFNIRHCEISSWHLKVRCKEHLALLNSTNDGAKFDSDDPIVRMKQFGDDYFQASINNLRMITNYSVSVKAYRGEANRSIREQFSTNHISATDYKQGVMVETKSFAAKTLRCLANSSDIQIQTGPFFGGKISVEGSNNPLCSIYGNRNSPLSIYNFSINHNICNSKIINNTRIEAMVIVHENKEILTHNSKRYLVVCTFAPESYTLTASVAVPSHLIRKLFEKIRTKPVQVSIQSSNGSTEYGLYELDKKKRFATAQKVILDPKLSHLRDSRMLEQDRVAKFRINTEDQSLKPKFFENSLLLKNLTIITSLLLFCSLVIMYISVYRGNPATRIQSRLIDLNRTVVLDARDIQC